MTERLPFSEVRKPSAGETVDWDLPCAKCRYNLRTLAFGGTCPECGRAVTESLLGRRAAAVMPGGFRLCGWALAVWLVSWWLASGGYIGGLPWLIIAGLSANALAKWMMWCGEVRICSPAALPSIWPAERKWAVPVTGCAAAILYGCGVLLISFGMMPHDSFDFMLYVPFGLLLTESGGLMALVNALGFRSLSMALCDYLGEARLLRGHRAVLSLWIGAAVWVGVVCLFTFDGRKLHRDTAAALAWPALMPAMAAAVWQVRLAFQLAAVLRTRAAASEGYLKPGSGGDAGR